MALILGRHPITILKMKSFTNTFKEVGVTAPSVFATAIFFWKDSKIPRKTSILDSKVAGIYHANLLKKVSITGASLKMNELLFYITTANSCFSAKKKMFKFFLQTIDEFND